MAKSPPSLQCRECGYVLRATSLADAPYYDGHWCPECGSGNLGPVNLWPTIALVFLAVGIAGLAIFYR